MFAFEASSFGLVAWAFRRRRLLSAADAMTCIFESDAASRLTLRGLRPGDLGLVTVRQGVLYAEEYGWSRDYEALVARILVDFHQSFDPSRNAAWIADMDGLMLGSIFLASGDRSNVGALRLLYVEPEARGAGVGKLLVDACIKRAREVGYERLDLSTNRVLTAALSIHRWAGFVLVDEAPHRSFGHDLVSQSWSLTL